MGENQVVRELKPLPIVDGAWEQYGEFGKNSQLQFLSMQIKLNSKRYISKIVVSNVVPPEASSVRDRMY